MRFSFWFFIFILYLFILLPHTLFSHPAFEALLPYIFMNFQFIIAPTYIKWFSSVTLSVHMDCNNLIRPPRSSGLYCLEMEVPTCILIWFFLFCQFRSFHLEGDISFPVFLFYGDIFLVDIYPIDQSFCLPPYGKVSKLICFQYLFGLPDFILVAENGTSPSFSHNFFAKGFTFEVAILN